MHSRLSNSLLKLLSGMYSEVMSQATGWPRAPLLYVVAQLFIDQNHALTTQLSALHLGLAKVGYTARREQEFQQVDFNLQTRELRETNGTLYEFAKPDLSHLIFIGKERIDFATSQYSKFEVFLAEFQTAIQAVSQVLGETFLVRLDLRYIDWLEDQTDLPLEDQLIPNLHPPVLTTDLNNGQLINGHLILQSEHDGVQLQYQSMRGQAARNHLAVFGTVRPPIKRLTPMPTQPDGIVLDFDCFKLFDALAPNRPDLMAASTMLEHCHETASTLFKQCISSAASEYFQSKP